MTLLELQTNRTTLYHGSDHRIEKPVFGFGNPHNDYGLGFYCTEHVELAREWACPIKRDGYVNAYSIDLTSLRVLDLERPEYNILNWLALLVQNRSFDATTPLIRDAKAFILQNYLIALDGYDVVIGYRADDSYFSFARAFLDNRISLRQLEYAMKLGKLGRQVALVSPTAFDDLAFEGAEFVSSAEWHPRRLKRDANARKDYQLMLAEQGVQKDDVFMLDLLRGA